LSGIRLQEEKRLLGKASRFRVVAVG
jgi:hypothetical protein